MHELEEVKVEVDAEIVDDAVEDVEPAGDGEATDAMVGGKKRRNKSAKKRKGGAKKVAKKSAKKAVKKVGKKSAKKVAKKSTKKTKKAPSKWIMHVKSFAKSRNIKFGDAMKHPDCKKTYKSM